MINPQHIFGRLGNQMFQYATLLALSIETGSNIYFQDEKWFCKFEKQVKELFGAGIGLRDETSIHVRRGDYLQLEETYPNLCKTDYYQRATDTFPKDTKFIVFSDDIEWCKTFAPFQGDNFSFSEGKSEVHDLNMMASCKNNIIANSTFSWWAAYLNKHEDKIVICPEKKNWYSGLSLLDSWKQI